MPTDVSALLPGHPASDPLLNDSGGLPLLQDPVLLPGPIPTSQILIPRWGEVWLKEGEKKTKVASGMGMRTVNTVP
jgi:hypothetical protein